MRRGGQEWKWWKRAGHGGDHHQSKSIGIGFIIFIFLLIALALLRFNNLYSDLDESPGFEAASVLLCGDKQQDSETQSLQGINRRHNTIASSNTGKDACRRHGEKEDGQQLPKSIIRHTTDLEFRSMTAKNISSKEQRIVQQHSHNLLAIPVGFNQKEMVDQIISKFSLKYFTVMLFHYDGIVDKWKEFPWNDKVVHIAAINQTKWWFAKRFLHPDIVAPYKYIFLWDEDIGLDNFNPTRYLSIVEKEGLEISQPALDREKSFYHHEITARQAGKHVHRRIYSSLVDLLCFENSTEPPCTGWVEMMVPVFSRTAWRCTWHMIQNDLVIGWGLDMKLGYCVQGNRSQKVGVVDDEYVVHYSVPSLGGESFEKDGKESPLRKQITVRSYEELRTFNRRWNSAVKEDKCWTDPYK